MPAGIAAAVIASTAEVETEADATSPTATRSAEAATNDVARPAVEAVNPGGGIGDDDAPFWPDETAEVAFLSESKDRGEVPVPVSPTTRAELSDEASERGALPPLDELVNRIPAEVRDTLDELFRAKFVTVKRLPKKAFKS